LAPQDGIKEKNVDVRNKLLQGCLVQQNWLQHVNRMENSSLTEITVRYQPHGRRGCGTLKKKVETIGSSERE